MNTALERYRNADPTENLGEFSSVINPALAQNKIRNSCKVMSKMSGSRPIVMQPTKLLNQEFGCVRVKAKIASSSCYLAQFICEYQELL